MVISQNIHPSYSKQQGDGRKWEKVYASFGGRESGSCVTLHLTDQEDQYFDLAIHYASDPQGLVDKLKTAILSLPAIVRENV